MQQRERLIQYWLILAPAELEAKFNEGAELNEDQQVAHAPLDAIKNRCTRVISSPHCIDRASLKGSLHTVIESNPLWIGPTCTQNFERSGACRPSWLPKERSFRKRPSYSVS
jgi:hypothetical protein